MSKNTVTAYIYDLSHGYAKEYSKQNFGVQVDIVYHVSIVLNKKEYWFCESIQSSDAKKSSYGSPCKQIDFGVTEFSEESLLVTIENMREEYNKNNYCKKTHSAIDFAQELLMVLTGKSLPDEILKQRGTLPKSLLDTIK